jgi:hypothetical protein
MIPKRIYYVWLSGEDIPLQTMECIESWKTILYDYEIILLDKKNVDIKSIKFVSEACRVKKWAFACDYIRLYILYTNGGIYLDSDVLVKKSFDKYLTNDFFSSVEYHPSIVEKMQSKLLLHDDGRSKNSSSIIPGIGIQAAIMGSVKGHPFIKQCMDYYIDKHFINDDGSLHDDVIAPSLFAIAAEDYGFRYIDKVQLLDNNMLILPSSVFASTRSLATSESSAIHCCAGSWRIQNSKNIFSKLYEFIRT